jgi:hypothetical protein
MSLFWSRLVALQQIKLDLENIATVVRGQA